MSNIDVSAEIDISAAPADIAAVMFDAAREPDWIKAVSAVELIDPALAPGAKVRHQATVMGRAISWVSEVDAVHFPHVLAFRINEKHFVGTLRYDIQRSGIGSHVRVRTNGAASGLGFIPVAMVEGPLRSALAADLDTLKSIVEGT